MDDEATNIVHFPPASDTALTVSKRQQKALQSRSRVLSRIGVTEESLLANLADLATKGAKIKTVKDGKGAIITETVTEDPAIRLAATTKLLDMLSPAPKSKQTMYAEKIEW